MHKKLSNFSIIFTPNFTRNCFVGLAPDFANSKKIVISSKLVLLLA